VITVAAVVTDRLCPTHVCFVNVDGRPLFLCSHATGTTIAATKISDIRAGELDAKTQTLVYTGNPWDDVTIDGPSTHLVLTGVKDAMSA
jgi:hypothetical protein